MVVTATEQLVVRESHAHHTIRVAQELIKALLGLDVPNSNRVVVARREKPLIKDFAVLVSFAVSVDGHHPALVSDELFYITLDQVVRSDYLVTAADKEPLFVQVKAVDCILRCYERLVNFPGLQIDSSDYFVPRTREKQVHILMNDGAVHRIAKLVNTNTVLLLYVPLPNCAIVCRTEQVVVAVSEVVDLVCVADERLELGHCHFSQIISDFPEANKPVAVADIHED